MKSKPLRRIISFLLSIIMVFSVMPEYVAYAEEKPILESISLGGDFDPSAVIDGDIIPSLYSSVQDLNEAFKTDGTIWVDQGGGYYANTGITYGTSKFEVKKYRLRINVYLRAESLEKVALPEDLSSIHATYKGMELSYDKDSYYNPSTGYGTLYYYLDFEVVHHHRGGVATCVSPATCEVCEEPYGELSTQHKIAPVTMGECTYIQCSDCKKMWTDETLEEEVQIWDMDATHHWIFGKEEEKEEHSLREVIVEEATPTKAGIKKTICDICGYEKEEPYSVGNMCGEKAAYTYDEATATITIYGEGATFDFEKNVTVEGIEYTSPWTGDAVLENAKKVIIKEGITGIGAYAFSDMMNLETVELPSSVKKIGKEAFAGDGSLENIDLSKVEYIDEDAFFLCTGLRRVDLLSAIHVGKDAFTSCIGIVNLALSTNVDVEYDILAFRDLTGLTRLEIPSGTVRESAFEDSVNLEEVYFGKNVKEIENFVFSQTRSTKTYKLEKIHFEGDAPIIGDVAFKDVRAVLYYPKDNETWSEIVSNRTRFGGQIVYAASGEEACEHELTGVKGVAATCTKDGYKACYRCKNCGKAFADKQATILITDLVAWRFRAGKIEKKEHTFGDYVVTETEHYLECSVCGEKAEQGNHRGGAATCAAKAKCVDCGAEYGGLGIHVPHYVAKVPATCVEYGVRAHYMCACGIHYTDLAGKNKIEDFDAWKENVGKLPMLAHDFSGKVTDEGECSGCGIISLSKNKYITASAPTTIWDGEEHTPSPAVFHKGNHLTLGVDYTVESIVKTEMGTYDVTITGVGAYCDSITVEWRIVPSGFYCVEIPDQTYTGAALTPKVTVYYGGRLLVEGVDYALSYKNNVKVAEKDAVNAKGASVAPTITITGKGNYSDKKMVTFAIKAADIADFDVAEKAVNYNGKELAVTTTVSKGKKTLKAGVDYVIVDGDGNPITKLLEDGKYDLKVKGIGSYKGTKDFRFVITKDVMMNKLTISKIVDQPYTGAAIEPAFSVFNGKELVPNNNFYISYSNNTEIGTATITLTAKPTTGFYGSRSYTFKIVGKNISKAVIAPVAAKVYDGESYEPALDVKFGDKELKEGVDYTVVYAKNTGVGNATATIKGIGEFSGSKNVSFKITPYDAEKDEKHLIRMSGDDLNEILYVKGGAKPAVVVKFNGTVLKEKTDYTIAYKNNTAAANATDAKAPAFTITYKGNYKGKTTVNYTINKKPLYGLDGDIIIADKVYSEKKDSWKQTAITLTDSDGKKLAIGKDFTIKGYFTNYACTTPVPESGVEAGREVYVLLEGHGNYEGTKKVVYRVGKKTIASAKVTAPSYCYTGSVVNPLAEDFKVVVGTETLRPGVDYSIDYATVTGVNKGSTSLTIRGKGDYCGTKIVKVNITVQSLNK